MKRLPLKIKIFLCIVFMSTLFIMYFFINTRYLPAIDYSNFKDILFFGTLAILTESFTVIFRKISLTTTFAITNATYILFGPLTTIIAMLIGLTFCVVKDDDQYKHILNTPWYGTVFNYCVYILSILIGNYFYLKLDGVFYFQNNNYDIFSNLPHIIIFTLVVSLVNLLIISSMSSIFFGKNIVYSLVNNVRLVLLNSVIMLPFAVILAVIYSQYKYFGVILFISPIILVRYTFSLYIQSKSQYFDTVNALMRAMEARDKYTEGHSQRVAELVNEIARKLKYNEWDIEKLNIASLLHDVGKIGIDDQILNKPGKLTEEEFSIIKSHPEIGYGILQNVKNLKEVIDVVRHHHERYDGKGYPQGKKADELSLDVFIVQLADSIDAMATDRPYRKALTQEQIMEELKKNSGTQFHPKVVDAYLKILEDQNKVV